MKGQPNRLITIYGIDKEYHATKGWRVGKRYGKN
jgi:aspartate/methionine/tyrosine aminotransferase